VIDIKAINDLANMPPK